MRRLLLTVLLAPLASLGDEFSSQGYQGSGSGYSTPHRREYRMPQDSYVVPRLDGGYTEVYPGRGSITVTGPDPLGVINIYRRGFLPPSRH